MSNTAVSAYDGTIRGNTFVGDDTGFAMESWNDTGLIFAQNRIIGDPQTEMNQTDSAIIVGNLWYGGSQNLSIKAFSAIKLSIVGNIFRHGIGVSQDYIDLRASPDGVLIADNIFTAGSIHILGETNIEAVDVVDNTFIGGGRIWSDAALANWQTNNIRIADNTFRGGEASIRFYGSDRRILDLIIEGNRLLDVAAVSVPLIDVRFQDDFADNGRGVRITDNVISAIQTSDAVDTLGIYVVGFTDKDQGAVEVSRNQLQGTDGITIEYVRDVVVRGNRVDVQPSATVQNVQAGQLTVQLCGTAVVGENTVVAGEDGDKAATTAVLYVEAVDGGSVRNNDVWGIVTGSLDTAIIVDGPFYIIGNAYHGAHSLNTGTEFSNLIVVVGSGASVGSNKDAADLSGASGYRSLNASFDTAVTVTESVGVTDDVTDVLTP